MAERGMMLPPPQAGEGKKRKDSLSVAREDVRIL
jgi:hypothetical protein